MWYSPSSPPAPLVSDVASSKRAARGLRAAAWAASGPSLTLLRTSFASTALPCPSSARARFNFTAGSAPLVAPIWRNAISASTHFPCESNAVGSGTFAAAALAPTFTPSFCKNARTCGSGAAPTNSAASRPSLKPLTVGMPWTPYCIANRWSSSVLILARMKPPLNSLASFSSTGPNIRQGPHQGAQKSTTMGTCRERSSTSAWNVVSVTSITYSDFAMFAPHARPLTRVNQDMC